MKRQILSLSAVAILSLASLDVFAQGKNLSERVTFREPVWVNTTLIEPGKYTVTYNAQTGDMSIIDGNKVAVTTKATIKTYGNPFARGVILTAPMSEGRKLAGIRLAGQREEIFVTDLTAEMAKSSSN